MPQLILLRHGQSTWNRDNRFTGWTDVDLTDTGIEEARAAARLLSQEGVVPDVCFTSVLKRAIRTLWIVLDAMDLMWLPTEKSWRLNERHYGALQGLHKGEVARQMGADRVRAWRRSYTVRPPALEDGDERLPERDRRYAGIARERLPRTESLADTVERVVPYWHEAVAPRLQEDSVVFVVAHGNSLRGLVKYLDDIPDEEIPSLEIPTGVPLLYRLDRSLKPTERRYLGPGRLDDHGRSAGDPD